MSIKNIVLNAEQLIKTGKFQAAQEIFSDLYEQSDDPVTQRIALNRLNEIAAKVKACNHTLDIKSNFAQDFLLCRLKIKTPYANISHLIQRIYDEIHKKEYHQKSNIELSVADNSVTLLIYSYNMDEQCCHFCNKFRQKLIDNLGSDDLFIRGNCYQEKHS